MPVERAFYRWLCRHPVVSFLLMTGSFLAFGYFTLDLVQLIGSNAAFIVRHGWLALMSGGLLQLGELTLIALLAMACYLLFRLCEQALLQRLTNRTRAGDGE
ncbi:hypothetical protein ACSX1C_08935 [Pseudomonas sp. MBLB4123]|uniref:Uncharacterized protein n=1 Tax=Pseudomonas benzenivorans TaxID=556533 RepID=A0ABZ0PZ30_9PSED|nr:hypothetical protein [Pseudomonas benzenivorans]WPC06477.1 hypothetical protein SBP02_06895 [Pseudomonas benzenivorans]